MLSFTKFFGILTFQAMLIVAKRIINFCLDVVTSKKQQMIKSYNRTAVPDFKII